MTWKMLVKGRVLVPWSHVMAPWSRVMVPWSAMVPWSVMVTWGLTWSVMVTGSSQMVTSATAASVERGGDVCPCFGEGPLLLPPSASAPPQRASAAPHCLMPQLRLEALLLLELLLILPQLNREVCLVELLMKLT